jgi:hypothetical protein
MPARHTQNVARRGDVVGRISPDHDEIRALADNNPPTIGNDNASAVLEVAARKTCSGDSPASVKSSISR